MTLQTITREEVREMILSHKDVILLDVLPGEFFAEQHLPGAGNACVYEMTFLDQVNAITKDLDRPIIVYGSSCRSRASATAATKLVAAGYHTIYDYAGGLEAWEAGGYPLERHPEQAVAIPCFRDATYVVDVAKSVLLWVGRSLTGRHHGSINLADGELTFARGRVVRGNLTLDMETIRDFDLTDAAYNSLLISHLKSDDFFNVSHFPTASFELGAATPIPTATPGTANQQITGVLTIKGIGNQVSFPAHIAPSVDGGLYAQAHLDIDRTLWGVHYGSGKLFERLGMHLVNDIISLELLVVAF